MQLLHLLTNLLQSPMASPQCAPWEGGEKCVPTASSCEFYTCLDHKAHCGPTGYPLGYAKPFCEAITSISPSLSSGGQEWYSATKFCLQKALIIEAKCQTSCFDIFNNAFASHVPCYVNSGFCTLGFEDLKIFFQLAGVNGTVSNEGLGLFSNVLQQCVGKYQNDEVHGGWVEYVVKLLEGKI